jgi:N-acetylneuraminate synthase
MKINDIFYGVQRNSSILTPPYVIAEAGVNHEGDMGIARRLIDEAAEAGANAIKFQTYKAGMLASKNSPSYWDSHIIHLSVFHLRILTTVGKLLENAILLSLIFA